MSPRRPWICALVVSTIVLLSGCRTTVGIEITQNDSAGGTISVQVGIDEEALAALGGGDVILTEDLEGTTWEVSKPTTDADGTYVVSAERDFADAGELQQALDEIAGPGVFTDVTSQVQRGFAMTEHTMSLDVSVSGDWAQFSDDALTETLGGLPIGYTPNELALLGADQPGVTTMEVTLVVPGGTPDSAEFDLGAGGPQSAALASASEDRDSNVIVIGAVGSVLVLMGLITGIAALLRRRRRKR